MRIYFEPLPDPQYSDEVINNPVTGPLVQKYLELAIQSSLHLSHKFKYRLSWELRHLETEINEEDGMIIMTADGQINIKEFTEELTEKIKEVVTNVNWNTW